MNRARRLLLAAVMVAVIAPTSDLGALPSAAPDLGLASAAAADGSPLPPESGVVAPAAPASAPADWTAPWIGTLKIPALRISQRVYDWGCGPSVVPNIVIRWGCARSQNMFLAGHAYGVFHSYYLAYRNHRLRAPMYAYFTDRRGHTTRYRLVWVRTVTPTYEWRGLTGSEWAWNDTATPSITLQTCYGPTNAYRIISRFVRG